MTLDTKEGPLYSHTSSKPIPADKLIFGIYADGDDGKIGMSVNPGYCAQLTDNNIEEILSRVKLILSGYVQRQVS